MLLSRVLIALLWGNVGLFETVSELLLRYQWTDHLEVESRSGENQSVDLYYLLEHD